MRLCGKCKLRPRKPHHNARWCHECAEALKRRPKGKLTPAQQATVRRLAGTMFIKELAKEVGTSDSNLDRWAKQNGINVNALKYPEELVNEVCEFYAKHGKIETAKRFPDVKIRSIVERYAFEPRQIRWTDAQLVQLAKMGGLISPERQAAFFDRPRAFAGSIGAAWNKRLKCAGAHINGLSHWFARKLVTPTCPFHEVDFWKRRDPKSGLPRGRRRVALWIDIAENLRPDIPEHLVAAVEAMARFQKWLHGPNYRASLNAILRGDLG